MPEGAFRSRKWKEARVLSTKTYSEPVKKLLTHPEQPLAEKWLDYGSMGLTREHIGELIDMAVDKDLHLALSESPEVWAPVHAWRALAQLGAVEAIEPLIGQFYRIDEENDDAVGEDMPIVFSMLGPEAVRPLEKYLQSTSNGLFARVCAAHCLETIASKHPAVRDLCVQLLMGQLLCYDLNDPTLNGFVVANLVALQASEVIDCIRQAFALERVDPFVVGDLEEVEMQLGLRTERFTSKPEPPFVPKDLRRLFSQLIDPATAMDPATGKPGRNDPCPCGSGKKYKHCCLP